ncbi:hypothetical protein SDC9_83165 [bioreactor metagenome]|uniref:Uncharacterized protein n=1 Tax=bioreactor metagenome TaxID=1076179 RepID=A0A644Z6S9_9ZZZZ
MASAENSYENTPDWYREKYAPKGGEIAGYVSWLMRDALSVAGKFSDGTYPRAYIRETADQIIAACDSGQLDCTNQISIPRLGAFRVDHLPIFFDYIKEDLRSLFSYDNSFSRIFPLSITQGAFTKTNSKFAYFDEFVNNPIDMRTMVDRVNADNRVMVGEHNELRLVMLNLKQRLMGYSVAVYKYLTLVFLILTIGFWLISIILRLSKKQKIAYSSTINLALFFLVLFCSRLGMLDVLRATSTLPGSYAATCYLFMYCFAFFLLTGAINNFEVLVPDKKINQDESLASK